MQHQFVLVYRPHRFQKILPDNCNTDREVLVEPEQAGSRYCISPAKNALAAKSLKENVSWTFAGNVVFAVARWATLAIIAKLGDSAMVGQYGFAGAICMPVVVFFQFGLRILQTTDAKRQFQFQHYLAFRLVTTGASLLVIGTLIWLGGYAWDSCLLIALIALAYSMESIGETFLGLYQQSERMDFAAKSKGVHAVLLIVLPAVGLYATQSVLGAALGLAVAVALKVVLYDLPTASKLLRSELCALQSPASTLQCGRHPLLPRFHLHSFRSLLWLGLPLAAVMMVLSLSQHVPRYFIEHRLQDRDLGHFVAMASLAIAQTIVANAIGAAATPRMARLYANGNLRGFGKLIAKMLGLVGAIGIGGLLVAWVAGRELLTILFTEEYAKDLDVFLVLMATGAVMCLGTILGNGVSSMRRFRIQLAINCVKLGVVTTGCYYAVGLYGLLGAAWALLAAEVISIICYGAIILSALWRQEDAAAET